MQRSHRRQLRSSFQRLHTTYVVTKAVVTEFDRSESNVRKPGELDIFRDLMGKREVDKRV